VAEEPSNDVPGDLSALDATLTSIEKVLDLPRLRIELGDLEEQAGDPTLWDDTSKAQEVTTRLSGVRADIERVEGLRRRLDDLSVLFEMAAEEADEATLDEAHLELRTLQREIASLEVRTLLSGEYDERHALVQITPGAGGVDSQDWALMLWRMYSRWAERHGYPIDVLEWQEAEEAGVKSVVFQVKAPYAYGTLSVEQGTHRLVRISPFDNQGRRQTSFAGVEVAPVVETSDHVEIDEKDLRVDVYRSSGPGGQGVNTTDSAVRITHIPTGIVVSCQNERSQIQNRASAMTVLQAKLLARRRQEEKATMDALKDGGNSWGNQMRSYVLHPYQMVKDLRTNFEVGNPSAVFDGEIDEFIEAGIRWRRSADAEN
jgi:peptide chain release factor 2